MRKLFILCIALLLLPVSSLAAEREQYVALGDSVAAGQTPYREIDTGYVDLIAQQLGMTGRLASYDRSLPFPGLTIEEVLATTQSEQARELLAKATLITISAGANNLLPLIAHNPNAGTLAFSQLSADFALNKVRLGMEQLLQELEQLAPNAKVYVIGYYFPYTHVHDEQKDGAAQQLALMNTILQQQAESFGATFVEVESAFGNERLAFLPNSADVHPSRLGYLAIANAFFASYGLPALTEAQLPPANPQSFEQLLQQQEVSKSQQVAIKPTNSLATYIVHYGYTKALL